MTSHTDAGHLEFSHVDRPSSKGLPDVISSIKREYRSGRDDIGKDFFVPCLEHCYRYRRAVGFFSSSSLITWASVLPRFMELPDLKIQLLISPHLSEQDKSALESATESESSQEVCKLVSDRIIKEALAFSSKPGDVQLRLRLFAWLIVHNRLELRFAFPSHVSDAGIFHQKIGIFDFPGTHQIGFTGSANESDSGHRRNYETVDAFRSWIPEDAERVKDKVDEFDAAWDGRAQGLRILPLSETALAEIIVVAPDQYPGKLTEHTSKPAIAASDKWRHQDEAIEKFLSVKYGILEMATGTGKTRTALEILKRLAGSEEISTVIISTDGNDLLDQWFSNILTVANEIDYSVTRRYQKHNDQELFSLNPSRRIHLCSRQRLPAALAALPFAQRPKTLLIHDEVHRLGSPANRRDLDGREEGIRYRLGLSATPDREYDDEGNLFIEKHIGPTIYQFPLEKAIERGILAPFNYYPLEWSPTEDDRANIQKVYKMASAREASGTSMPQEEIWMRIASVYKTSETKLPIIKKFLKSRPDLVKRSIIFVATHEYAEHVIPYIHDLTLKFHTYFDGDKKETLKRFSRGELDCLITCHRLSEGIDIQSIRTVILLSADRARLETIQRIGRCLRVDPSDPAKRANVVDFIRMPDADGNATESADIARSGWLSEVSQVQPETAKT